MCAWIKQQVYWSAIVISSTWPTDQVNFQPHRHGYSCSLQIQMQHLAQTVHCRKQFGQWAPGLTHHLYLGLINLHLNSGPFLLPSSSSCYKNGNKINLCGTIQPLMANHLWYAFARKGFCDPNFWNSFFCRGLHRCDHDLLPFDLTNL